MFKSICLSSLNWRAGALCLNAPSREAYRSRKTSWLCTTASHSGQTPFWHHTGHSELTKTSDGMSPDSGDTDSDPSNRRMVLKIQGQLMLACVEDAPSPLRKKKKVPSLHMLPWYLPIFIQVSHSIFRLHFHRLQLKTIYSFFNTDRNIITFLRNIQALQFVCKHRFLAVGVWVTIKDTWVFGKKW